MILERLPRLKLGQHAAAMGNTGEGKTAASLAVLLPFKNYIILNTKNDPSFGHFGETIKKDRQIYLVRKGRFEFRPSDAWKKDIRLRDQFFDWALRAGNRAIYVDEVNDICPSAQIYPYNFQKAIKQGRWKKLSLIMGTQEPIRVPSFVWSQAKYRLLFYVGWPLHRKLAEAWYERSIDWSQIPELSHMFYLKLPGGVYGPQPPLNAPFITERLAA